MRTVDDFARIRRAHRDGMSLNEICRRLHHSKATVRKALASATPARYTRRQPITYAKLGGHLEFIDRTLTEDEQAPPKQRHTAQRLFERLRDEQGYQGGYDAVRRYVAKRRRGQRETFIPLSHEPGQRLECDFGHIHVDIDGTRRRVAVLIMVWSYSNCPFAVALPSQRTEAILEGMVRGLRFFGSVPREVWWDNPKTVAAAIFTGRERRPNPHYAALCSHYVMEPLYCLPARGNEKPVVENRVKTLQRRWATPVPRVRDLAELNELLLSHCLRDRSRQHGDSGKTIAERFAEDRAAAGALPEHAFDPCVRHERQADKYQQVRFENVSYSVPRQVAFGKVTVKAYTDRIEIVHQHQVVARHERSYDRNAQVLDPLHYLSSLERRPAALDHAAVFANWRLPASFETLRRRLEERLGTSVGVRHYVRVLQLLQEHPLVTVRRVVEAARAEDLDAERLAERVRRAAAGSGESPSTPVRDEVLAVQVPERGLGHFNRLLSQGGENDDQGSDVAAQDEPQAASLADDAGGVREAGPSGGGREPELRGVSAEPHGIGGLDASWQCIVSPYQASVVSGAQGLRQF